MVRKSATTPDVILLLLTTIVVFVQVQRDPTRIHVQTRTITNREQHLRKVITLTTIITAAVEAPMPEVRAAEAPAAEVVLLLDQVIARVRQVQAEEINIHIHSN